MQIFRQARRSIFFTAAVALVLAAQAATAERVEVRTLNQTLVLGDAGQVHVNLSFGDLTVEGTGGDTVEIELALDCSRADMEACKARAERIRLAPRMAQGELRVRLKNTPRARLRGIQARLKVRMPHYVPLEVDVRSGGVYVTGLTSDLNINSGAGDVDVLAARHTTGRVNVDVGFGKADLWVDDSRIDGTGWPRSLDWHGSGAATIEIDVVGSGDVSVRLE